MDYNGPIPWFFLREDDDNDGVAHIFTSSEGKSVTVCGEDGNPGDYNEATGTCPTDFSVLTWFEKKLLKRGKWLT